MLATTEDCQERRYAKMRLTTVGVTTIPSSVSPEPFFKPFSRFPSCRDRELRSQLLTTHCKPIWHPDERPEEDDGPIVDVEGYKDAAAANRERLVRGKLAGALVVSSQPRCASTHCGADVSYAS